ncbi:hypothetical protein P4574_23685 [Priestia megaterium]|uniref:hypothetical protein n=1 Tax=Priestia megaterium TaxID=1404 RepID=UPI002E1D5FAF|nr:hypothetical protein [Priestia megaterium]
MNISRKIGDLHVKSVYHTLREYLKGNSIQDISDTTKKTVDYLVQRYPNIKEVYSKFETEKPDLNPDLLLILDNGKEEKINLFYINGKNPIQPKNLGAKSFLEKYFLSQKMQLVFNNYFTQEYDFYLKSILKTKENEDSYDQTVELRKKVKSYYPSFTPEINPFRQKFLFCLREYCFKLLKEEYNEVNDSIQHAFKEFFMLDSTVIITRYYNKNKSSYVEELTFNVDSENEINIYKIGNDTIGIRCGEEALTIRFKFESSPTSSVKLATSYKKFPSAESIVGKNKRTISKFESIINNHELIKAKNISNAIGKCNEAMIYYQLLKNNLEINQVDPNEYWTMLDRYSPIVPFKDLLALQQASITTIHKLNEYLKNKYGVYKIDSIQLVPDSYLKDRLNTADLQLILFIDNKYIEEAFSLKALSTKSTTLNVKNPGIGQILGPQYFDIGDLSNVVSEAKNLFLQGMIDHQNSLKKVSEKLGEQLALAAQVKLRKGVQSILGNSIVVLTFYKHNDSKVLEYNDVDSEIFILKQHPRPTHTTLYWNDKQEELSLRVKFSGGQSKGWSSLKLACGFKISIKD